MASAGLLATNLDEAMLSGRNVEIFPSATPFDKLESKAKKEGKRVSWEIGGRWLVHYLLHPQVLKEPRRTPVYVTPTPYAPDDTVSFLALPRAADKREFCILLMPEKIDWILGPRWILGGGGIECILPYGFELGALVMPWEVKIA
jgi:hypothetical protein